MVIMLNQKRKFLRTIYLTLSFQAMKRWKLHWDRNPINKFEERKKKMINYEEAIKVLKKLKKKARHVQEKDEYVRMDFPSNSVEDEKRAIVETLARLDLD